MKPSVELDCQMTQNSEPFVKLNFGTNTTEEQESTAQSMCRGYGLSCGYGPGRYGHGVQAAKRLATRLRRLGWSVSVNS